MRKVYVAIMLLCSLAILFHNSAQAVSTENMSYSDTAGISSDVCVKTVVIDRALYPESTHNYAHYLDETKSLSYPGAKSITLTFDSMSFKEARRDLLYIMDSTGSTIAVLSGDLRNKTFTVYDDIIRIRLVTDGTASKYGYRFSEISAEIYSHSPMELSECLPTCTDVGYTAGISCSECGVVLIEQTEVPANGHNFKDGICIDCGFQDKFDIAVSRMILGNALEFQFGVERSAQKDWTGVYAVIEKSWADGTVATKIIPYEDWGVAGPYLAIVYDGLAAKEMADSICVTVYSADGMAISNPKTDSVREYVERAFDLQNEAGRTMLVDMLNYGAAAQRNLKYNVTDLANNQLTEAQLLFETKEVAALRNNQVKGEHYLATRFVLESRIQVQVGFEKLTPDMYAIYSYTNQMGDRCEVRVEGTDFIVAGSIKGVELGKLVYADARTSVSVKVYRPDGTVYGSVQESIESCAYRSSSGDDVFVFLMKFADSARNYLY